MTFRDKPAGAFQLWNGSLLMKDLAVTHSTCSRQNPATITGATDANFAIFPSGLTSKSFRVWAGLYNLR